MIRETITKVRTLARPIRDLWEARSPGYLHRAFHGDPIYQELVETLIEGVAAVSIAETGTYFGDSTRFLAERFPSLPVYTCEIDRAFAARARRRLRRFGNVRLQRASSEGFIRQFIETTGSNDRVFFFLDAHWYDYWPLEDELRQISEAGVSAVIVIDDFEVPGRQQFGFDVEGIDASRADRGEQRVCGLPLVRECLSVQNSYQAVVPRYSMADAFPQSTGQLRGHIAIFQNLDEDFSRFTTSDEVLTRHYEIVSITPSVESR